MEHKEIKNKGKIKRLAKAAKRMNEVQHELSIYKAVLFALAEHNGGEFQVRVGVEKGNIATNVQKDTEGNWIITVRSSKENLSVQ